MENVKNKQESQRSAWMKKRFLGGYIAAGLVWTLAQNLKKSTIGELIILVIAIGAGFLYYPLKSKIKLKNEIAKIILIFTILLLASAFLIGFLTSLADNWKAIAVRTPLGTGIVNRDRGLLVQLNQDQKTFLADFQGRWEEVQKDIDEQSGSKIDYVNNIAGYKALQELNNERYSQLVDYSNQTNPILAKYSQNLAGAFSQLVKAGGNSRNVYDEIFLAKIDYFQALLDNKSEGQIETKRLIVNNAVDKLSQAEKEVTQAQDELQKAYKDFFEN